MKAIKISVIVLLDLSCSNYAISRTCSRGSPAAAVDSSSQLEYASGFPSKVEVQEGDIIRSISYTKVGNLAVFEGDIVLGDANQIEFAAQSGPIKVLRKTSSGSELTPFGYISRSVVGGSQRWTSNTIPYVIDPNLSSGPTVVSAMNKWEQKTKLKFVQRTSENAAQYRNYVYFTVGTTPGVCLSYGVGMMGEQQRVELIPDCRLGEIIHEIGHVIGLDHEQNRADRDKYVSVNFGNIEADNVDQFIQRPNDYKDVGQYDLDSIMHYQDTAFSCNGGKTITPLVAGKQIGQRSHVSDGDAATVNTFYK